MGDRLPLSETSVVNRVGEFQGSSPLIPNQRVAHWLLLPLQPNPNTSSFGREQNLPCVCYTHIPYLCRRPPGRPDRRPCEKGGDGLLMSPYGKDMNAFVDACEKMLSIEVVAEDLIAQQNQIIQYYLAALMAKFPALLS